MKPILHICKIDIFNSPFKYSTAFHTLPYHLTHHIHTYIYITLYASSKIQISQESWTSTQDLA